MRRSPTILAVISALAKLAHAQSNATSTKNTTTCMAFPHNGATGVPKSFWRLPCRGQSGIGRVDPLMDPGGPGPHVHTIAGGNGFGFNATYETLIHSTCTSCAVKQDKSAYWTPTLHFMYTNGTTVMVEQIGGMLAYYKSFADTKVFPEGFRMVAGNPYVRNFTGPFPDVPTSNVNVWTEDPEKLATPEHQFFLMQRALGFNCLNYYSLLPPEASLYRHQLPTKDYMDRQCIDGIRLELAFPTCGNGSIDSADHKSHMAYPSLVQQGTCPKGYDVRYPLLFYETNYNTWAFAGVDGQFVLSYGDPIGTGYHGDFMMGWDSAELLQSAMDTCRCESGRVHDCAIFDIASEDEQKACHFDMPESLKDDDPVGPRNGLAVDVPIQYGPGEATTYPVPGRSGVPTKSFEPSRPPRTFIGNLSIHPYGSVANPTLMMADSGSGAGTNMYLTTTAASRPIPVGMAPLSSIAYVPGVIAQQFSKYLTISPTDSLGTSTGYNPSPSNIASQTICNASPPRLPVSVETSYKTMGSEVVQVFIEDIELVVTTRTRLTVTGPTIDSSTRTIDSSMTFQQPTSSVPGPWTEGDFSQSLEHTNAPNVRFNTIMWVLGSMTFYTAPSNMETTNNGSRTQTTQNSSETDMSSSRMTNMPSSEPTDILSSASSSGTIETSRTMSGDTSGDETVR